MSGDVTVERDSDDLRVIVDSFHAGGNQTRLLLVDAGAEQLIACIPESVATASVGGIPAEPKSSFPFASASDFDTAQVPHFKSVVLVRQRVDGDPECIEPIVSVAPLAWSDANN
ncbi:hypothetical protein [Leifsonia poae]|uniref:hypothetical protein n=1 Tax=Leifsonia poae TaxID=110933 RepID=UPI003D6680A9